MHLSVYAVSRHYGGPEEGGWWYDIMSYVRTDHIDFPSREDALASARKKNRIEKETRERHGRSQGRFSVAGGTDYVWVVEEVPRERDNSDEPRPHYC